MPSAQDFAERLRKQAYKTLSPQIGDLEQELQNVASSLSAGVQQIERRLEALRHIELPTAEPILDEFLGDALRRKDLVTDDLASFTRGMRQRRTQEEILTYFLDNAQKCSPRIALYIIRGDQFIGWSSRGFSEPLAKNISSCTFSRSESPQFQEALENGRSAVVPDLTAVESLQIIKEESRGPWHLLPLRAMQRQIALLLAGGTEGVSVRSDSLSVLADFTMLQLENVALRILYELTLAKPEAAPQSAPLHAAVAPESAAEAEVEETREAQEPEPVHEPPASAEIEEKPEFQEPEPLQEPAPVAEVELSVETQEPEPIEEPVPVAEVEESLETQESEPAEEAALAAEIEEKPQFQESEAVQEPAPVAEVRESGETQEPEIEESHAVAASPEAAESRQEEPQREEIPPQKAKPKEFPKVPEEEKLHSDAKRFARLLVSEIKLYNENRVVEGRENRDIYIRLKRDIDRSREMYEKRVSPAVSQKIDYFHDEIVRILGDNDSSALGSDYPGSRADT